MERETHADGEIDRATLVNLTKELVGRASENPPGNERGVAEWLRDRLVDSPVDFDVEVREVLPDRPNVLARGGDPSRGSVLLTGHTDVVPADGADWSGDPYAPRERDGRIVGRGSADMKGNLAAMVLAAESYLSNADAPGEVVLAFVVDEENRGRGTQELVEDGLDVDGAIVGEPTNLDVCVAQKGAVRYELAIDGRSAHSGTPDEGVDAIRTAGSLLAAVESFDERLRTATSAAFLEPETVTVTELSGGSAPNVVAGHADLCIDWRFHPGDQRPDRFDEAVDRLIADADLDPDVDVTWERTVFARAAKVDADEPLVGRLVSAAEDNGVESDVVGFNGGTDARFLIHDADIPTVLLGAGDPAVAHAADEFVPTESLHDAAAIYRSVLDRSFA